MLNDGMLVPEIAERLGVSALSSVYRRIKRYGLQKPGTPTDRLRLTERLTERHREMIVGMLLGDASIPPLHNRYRNYYLSFSHSKRFEEYALWKAAQLAPFDRKLTPATVSAGPGLPKIHEIFTFQTITHPDFAEYRTLFYPEGKKIVPPNLVELLTTLGLAVWYMDDGHLSRWHTKLGSYCTFCTESFTLADQDRLGVALCNLCDVEPRFKNHGSGTGYRMYLDRRDSDRFASVVRPFVHSSLLYKLP